MKLCNRLKHLRHNVLDVRIQTHIILRQFTCQNVILTGKEKFRLFSVRRKYTIFDVERVQIQLRSMFKLTI